MSLKNEYGGCLPLERLGSGTNPYQDYDKLELNCGRAGIYAAVCIYGADTVWVPHYMCPTVSEYLDEREIRVKRYNLDKDYLPLVKALHGNEMLMWTDYYGCMLKTARAAIIEKYGKQLILDCTQALFSMPEDKRPWYVYSVRKFIGVPEGAYLVKYGINKMKYKIGNSCGRYDWTYLRDALKNGSNAVYSRYLENEERMGLKESHMESNTSDYLKKVDWRRIKEKRKKNFSVLHSLLGDINSLQINFDSESPFMYPLLIKDNTLRNRLVDKKIYVSQWWKSVLSNNDALKHEKEWAQYIVPLPVDQRYNESDMEDLATIVLEEVKNGKQSGIAG